MPSGIYIRSKEQKERLRQSLTRYHIRKYFPTDCPVCHKKFQPISSNGECTKTCSKKCDGESRRGKPTWLSEHVKKGECFNTGRTHFKKGVSSWSKGKKCPQRAGDKHYNWKGGLSSENKIIRHGIEYRLWQESVFARDNFTDQKTGIRGGNLHAHHILNFSSNPELRFAIDNGVTLSEKSHRVFHKKYGEKNNTREQLEEFLTKQ